MTPESLEKREVFRDTAASGTTGLHAAAQSDNARVRPYVLAMSVSELWVVPPPVQWWVLVILTLISGSAVLKIPAVPVNFSISDVFTLTSAVVFGPAAGTALVAIDSLVLSGCLIRTGLSLERILFNATAHQSRCGSPPSRSSMHRDFTRCASNRLASMWSVHGCWRFPPCISC